MASAGRLRMGRPATEGWDYTYSDDAGLAVILALGGATLSGKRIGGFPGTYTTPALAITGNAATVTFGAVSGIVRWERATLEGVAKIKFQDIKFTSATWPGATSATCTFNDSTIGQVDWVRCDFRGNYQGDVDYAFDPTFEYPEYASITPTVSGGAITALTVTNANVSGLIANQTNLALTSHADSDGSGFTGLVDVVGGNLTNPRVSTGGSGYGGGESLTLPVTWAGQDRATLHMVPAFLRESGAAILNGPFTFTDCDFSLLLEACKGMTAVDGTTISGCTFDMIYSDKISLGTSTAGAVEPVVVQWCFSTRPLCKEGDPGDPHGDGIQMFMDAGTTTDWEIDITGNIFTTGAARGRFQPYFITNPASTSIAYTGRITGNIGLNREQGNGLMVEGSRNIFIYGNTVLRYDTADALNVTPLNLRLSSTAADIHEGTFIGGNMIEGFSNVLQGANVDATSVQNVFLGENGANVAYASAVSNPDSDPTTIAAHETAYESIGVYAGVGAARASNYVDFVNRVIDRTLEPTVVNFTPITGATPSATQQTSNWSCILGGPDTVTVSVSGASGEWRAADDGAGTGATAWTSSAGSTTRGKFLQVRGTASASNAASVAVTPTLNGHVNKKFVITTVGATAFSAVDNQTTAYSTFPSPANETSICKFIFAWRGKIDTFGSDTLFGRASTFNVDQGTDTLSLTLQSSAIVSARVQADTVNRTHIVIVDFTKATIFEGGVQWWQDDQKMLIDQTAFDSLGGTRTSNLTAILGSASTLGMFARSNGTGITDSKMEFFWMHWGTSGGLTLPDLSDPTVRDKWMADNIGADGSGPLGTQPKLYYPFTAAGLNANLANAGSLTSLLTKIAGTYV